MSEHKLLDESPLIVLPSLAVAIGLQQAVFLQQLHYNLSFLASAIEKEDSKRRKERAAEVLWSSKGFGLRLWYRKTVADGAGAPSRRVRSGFISTSRACRGGKVGPTAQNQAAGIAPSRSTDKTRAD